MGLFAGPGASAPDAWPEGRPPERGVVEVDDIPAELAVKLGSAQVERYLAAYGLVLVTNFRAFVLLGRDPQGRREVRERFDFGCADAAAFFALARGTRRPAGLATRFAEFLERVLLHQAPLARPEEVAFFLASYARDALARVEAQAALPAFATLRGALQEALGMTFEGPKGEHLFRSTLVQTLFYGLFSAWVEVARDGGRFDWHAAGWNLHVPFVDTLFQRIATPRQLQPLGLEEPLSWAAAALERVDRETFFRRFDEADAVRYFYEPFLAAFDPDLRKAMGVWYTPREIVRYMVERVDRVLREELGLADGLADPSVWVLDPCCGTGAYLVEVLDRITRTLQAKGEGALAAEELKQAAMTRVAGFEIMPAPYVIAHWQVGHALRAAGAAPFRDEESAAVYLTNALTGWAAPEATDAPDATQRSLRVTYPPLADERDKAARVKRERPILVVLGNPPYNAFAGTSPAEESGLVEAYKEGLQRDWGIRKFNLDDLYVRFFRVAERRIAEGTGRGVVCFISNHSWVWYPSFVVMRQRLAAEFDRIWIDNLNGSKFETGKVAPDGSPDPSVFSTEANREGIQVGTAIATFARRAQRTGGVAYRDLWGSTKRAALLDSLDRADFDAQYAPVALGQDNRFAFRPNAATDAYAAWTPLPKIAAIAPLNGLMEKRGGALIDSDRDVLADRMKAYFDPSRDWDSVKAEIGGLGVDAARFPAKATRERAVRQAYEDARIVPYFLRPFDQRWAYVTPLRPVWNEPRPELLRVLPVANGFIGTRPSGVANPEGVPLTWTPHLGDDHALRTDAYYAPMQLRGDGHPRANLSQAARAWLAALGLPDPDSDPAIAVLPWHHALAIGYAPAWLAENEAGIRQDWPRVPLPGSAPLLRASAGLGARVAALLDPDTPVQGVTSGTILPVLAAIAVPTKPGGGAMAGE
ncbi:MAG: N-6 DNA methylase, partial [Rhodospirillales bacterium]|nr:N-6 DNA methylase [Rhodospirillales bacterium]